MKYFAAVLLAVLSSTSVHAIDEGGNYAVWGVGKKSCFHYTKARENDDYAEYSSYIKGFLTAFNIIEPKTYNISGSMGFNEILDWIDDTCELKQIHSVEQTLLEFIEQHYDSRKRRANLGRGR